MTAGQCPYCGNIFANLEEHCTTYHKLPYFNPRPISNLEVIPQNKPHIETPYCPTCGQKQKKEQWKEVLIGFARYGLMLFWIGVALGFFEAIQSIHNILGR